ncbi:MAG: MarP family serine protease [Actinomycetota bacterium]|nr:MarP family serine protease [Actinomycetota bacterium]
MNLLDVLLVLMLILAGISGFRRGVALQLLSFGGLLVGLALGAVIATPLATLLESSAAQAWIAAITVLAAAIGGDWLGWWVGVKARTRARASRHRRFDPPGGVALSIVASLLAIWFVGLNLVSGPSPFVARQISGSAIVRALDDLLPPPPSFLAEVRGFFNEFGYPDVFTGIPPAPAEPVQPPDRTQAQHAFDAADQSTVRIVGQTCDHIEEGSGFVVATSYVVTAAHVVAGMREPQVQEQQGESQPATVVLFDPDLDLAVLLVSGTPPPLELANATVGRGAVGAVLGYPQGGALVGDDAAVRARITAVGRDIYENGEVSRELYELQAKVQPGDSGGPFVLVDGTVAGMVLGASGADLAISYAVTSTQIMPEVNRAIGGTRSVSTGACLR